MPRKPNPKPDDEEQSKKFLETAKDLDADKTGKGFERAMGVITPPRKPQSPKPT